MGVPAELPPGGELDAQPGAHCGGHQPRHLPQGLPPLAHLHAQPRLPSCCPAAGGQDDPGTPKGGTLLPCVCCSIGFAMTASCFISHADLQATMCCFHALIDARCQHKLCTAGFLHSYYVGCQICSVAIVGVCCSIICSLGHGFATFGHV